MYPKSNIPPLHTMPTLLLLLLLSSLCQLASTDKDPSSTSPLPPPAPQPVFQPPEQPPAAPFPLRRPPSFPYVDGYGYDVYYPHQKPVAVPVYQEPPSGGYMSSLIPATQSALQFTLRALAKFGLFLVGGAALLLVGGIFTTALCSLTPICVISFPGLTGIDKESVRSMMTPDRISAAAAMVQDAIGKYQRLQRAVGKR